MKYSLIFMSACLLFSACEKTPNDTTPTPGDNKMKITGTPDAVIYWGDEVSITGTDFSANKADYEIAMAEFNIQHQDLNKPEIISATATGIKVRIPKIAKTKASGEVYYDGPDWGDRIIINIKGKKDTTEALKIAGWSDINDVYAAEDGNTIMLSSGQYIELEISGATNALAPPEAERNVELRAVVKGESHLISFEWVEHSNNQATAKFYLDPKIFADVTVCDGDNEWNNGYRDIEFEVKVPGRNAETTKKFKMKWHPISNTDAVYGTLTFHKTPEPYPTNPAMIVTGVNMYHKMAEFVSYADPTLSTSIAIVTDGPPVFYAEGSISIPLYQLIEDHTYKVLLVDPCGKKKYFRDVKIVP